MNRPTFRPAWRIALVAMLLLLSAAMLFRVAAEEHAATPAADATPPPADTTHMQQQQRPRFAQHHTAHRASNPNFQHAIDQMRAWSHLGRSFSPFGSLFGGGGLDPFFGRGRGLGAPRARVSPYSGSLWPSLWHDPFSHFFDGPELNEWQHWPEEYDAETRSPAGALTTDHPDSPVSMGTMLSSSFDVREEPDRYTIDAQVPGWKPEELDVHIEGNELRLTGERKSEQTSGQQGSADSAHVKQYSYFTKRYRLPDEVKPEDLSASYSPKDHRLRIQLRKPHAALEAPPKPARIAVPLRIDDAVTSATPKPPHTPTKTFDDQPPMAQPKQQEPVTRIHDELRR